MSSLGCNVQVAFEELVGLTFKIHKHDAIAELGMAGDDESANDGGIAVEPEGEANANADGERDEELNVAASAAEVGSFEAHGNVAVFLTDLDLDLGVVTGELAAIGFGGGVGDGMSAGMGVGRIHGGSDRAQ